MKTIPLSKGFSMTVDDCDYEWLIEIGSWYAMSSDSPYAAKRKRMGKGKQVMLYAHRLIAEKMLGRKLEKGEQVDHVDRDRTNNTRSNLRVVTSRQNNMNRGIQSNNSGRFKGVVRNHIGKYRARLGKRNLGACANDYDAAILYNYAAYEAYGEFACLNSALD